MIQRSHALSTLCAGTVPPTRIWPSQNVATRERCQEVELSKANWVGFTQQVNMTTAGLPHPRPTNLNSAYDSYCKMLLAAAKKNFPRGVRKAYVPCWDDECEDLLRAHTEAQTNEDRGIAANDLFCRLNEKRRQRWTETVE